MPSVPLVTSRVIVAITLATALMSSGVALWTSPASAAPVGGLSKFTPVQPERILDTRSGLGAPAGALPADGTLNLTVLGRGGVPAGAVSTVVLNVTITATTGTGHVSVFPTNADGPGGTVAVPGTSAINHTDKTRTIAGLVHAPVGLNGQVSIYTARGGHLLADVMGFYSDSGESASGRFVPLSPARLLDTRTTTAPTPTPTTSPKPSPTPTATTPANPGDTKNCGDFSTWRAAQDWFEYYYPHYGDVARLDADGDLIACESLAGAPSNLRTSGSVKTTSGSSTALQVTGRGGVPASGVAAVALNITATQAERAGFVQVIPTGGSTATGTSSNLNVSAAGQTIANLVIVPVGTDGRVTLYTSMATHLLADVAGYYTDASAISSTAGLFQAVTPNRELDTRIASAYFGTSGQKPAAGNELRINMTTRDSIPSTGVAGVVFNVAAVSPAATGFVQVFPTGQATHGSSSNINFTAGQVIANSALARLGDQGQVSLYISQSTHLIADVYGYFVTEGATPTPIASPTASPTAAPTASPTAAPSTALQGLRIEPHNTSVTYNRDDWQHWVDDDGDCQNTRAEVLIVESLQSVTFTTASNCTVASGNWYDPYTGQSWTLASDVDVDHFVPLANAHVSGGHAWDAARKRAYANDMIDPDHLIAVEDNVNQSKGASAPDTWKPPRVAYWCTYAIDWTEVKKRWDLTVTQTEYDALGDMLATC